MAADDTIHEAEPAAIAVQNESGRIELQFNNPDAIDIPMFVQSSSANLTTDSLPSLKIPSMNICIMIVGTRGDVQPFVGIAKRLKADGHRVRLATHAVYRSYVQHENGIEFYPLGGDPKELASYMVKTGGHMIPLKYELLTKDTPRNIHMLEEITYSTWPAVTAADPEGSDAGLPVFQAHAIISNPVTYGHIHVAEKLGIPLHIMFPQPWVPTQEFPHPLSNLPYKGKREKRNYLSYSMVDALMWQGTEGMINRFRTEVLGLRKIRKGNHGRSLVLDWKIPHSFMWSEHLVPSPPDWDPALYDVIGTVTADSPTKITPYTPSPEFEAFLADGPPPIFVGFGSMVIPDAVKTTQLIINAAAAAHVRVVIQSSWSDMTHGGVVKIPSNIFILGNCPHDWLFPKMAAVVHHGGAGTTAAGLFAGKPTFIVPFFGDQPFWGWAIERAGVGVHPCPVNDLTVDKLKGAFEQMMSPAMIAKAQEMQAKMLKEDGVENAVESFYRHLPWEVMLCALTPEHLATKFLERDSLQVCAACAYVLQSRSDQAIAEHRYKEYGIVGPMSGIEGASQGTGALMHEIGGAVTGVVGEPARGFKEKGIRGGAVGVAKGVGGLVLRPLAGVAIFADHVATGHYNLWHRNDKAKQKQCRFDGRHLFKREDQSAIDKSLAPIVAVKLTKEEKETISKALDKLKHGESLTKHELDTVMTVRHEDDTDETSGSSGDDEDDIEINASVTDLKVRPDGTLDLENDVDKPEALPTKLTDTVAPILGDSWEDFKIPVKLSIAMLAVGTPHAIEMFIAVGKSLAEDGHRVRIAAPRKVQDTVRSFGLEYFELDGNPSSSQELLRALAYTPTDDKAYEGPWNDIPAFFASCWRAVKSDGFRADAIIAHPGVLVHVHVAERLGVPLHLLSSHPASPTKDFPHPLIETMRHPDKWSAWLSYAAIDSFIWRFTQDDMNRFRVQQLGLQGWYPQHPPSWSTWQIPITYCWSNLLLSKRPEWGSVVDVVGFVALPSHDKTTYVPPVAVAAFFDTNRATIYLAMDAKDNETLIPILHEVLNHHEFQIVLHRIDDTFENLFPIDRLAILDGSVPIEYVFSKCHGVVHQGRYHNVLAFLHDPKPAVVVPHTGIQKLWARRLHDLAEHHHVSPPVHFTEVEANAKALGDILAAVHATPSISAAFTDAVSLESKQAVRRAVTSFYKHLPLEAMVCDILPTKIARLYDPETQLKLSYEVDFVLRQDGHAVHEYVTYNPMHYSLQHGPQVATASSTENNKRVDKKSHKAAVGGLFKKKKSVSVIRKCESLPSVPEDLTAYWTTPQEEDELRRRVNAAYDALLDQQP
ncbi:hypothetical protein AeMF1_004274 [Aphanomyces euteiches]|nr:hypothetical protein AeMF1_004274 [Aphanomyces euteiches]KAH9187373.1 hypothetical protein AeNC1_010656 [Aphanomyces euteiches]